MVNKLNYYLVLCYLSIIMILPLQIYTQKIISTEKIQPNKQTILIPHPVSKDKSGHLPSEIMQELFIYYKAQNFKKANTLMSGKMNLAMSALIEKNKDKTMPSIMNTSSFYTQLVDMKILGEVEYKDYSLVSLSWISYLPEKYNTKKYYTKIAYVDYLLKKDSSGNWKINDAKFKKENIIYRKAPKL